MKEVNVFLKINDYIVETKGIIDNMVLSFNDQDELKTKVTYDYNNNFLIRDNNEITITLYFEKDKNNLEYILKSNNNKFFDNFTKISLHQNNKEVIINYRIGEIFYHMTLSYKED